MYSTNNPYGAGPSSRPIRPMPARRQVPTMPRKPAAPAVRTGVINITDSEPEINLVDSSDSEIEILGMAVPSVTKRPPPVLPARSKQLVEKDFIDLSLDEEPTASLSTVIEDRRNDGLKFQSSGIKRPSDDIAEDDSDDDSIPEGFEPWEPTVPLRITRTAPPPVLTKREPDAPPERELAWRPPKMDWFREDCTGASSAGAFIEPKVRSLKRKDVIEMVQMDFGFVRAPRKRPGWIRERSDLRPMRSALEELESGILFKDKIEPIPGMNASRGAVNCIAQSRGYIAIGRTYEDDVAYDGGGLAIWKVRTQRAYDIPAHITYETPPSGSDGSQVLPPERKQHSIFELAFDPANNTTLLSAGDDDRIELWHINEEDDKIDKIGKLGLEYHLQLITFAPGRISASIKTFESSIQPRGWMGRGRLRLYDVNNELASKNGWSYKWKGHQVVSIAWGVARSKDKIAAGAQDDAGLEGRVMFIDSRIGKAVRGADTEACTSLTLDPSGTVIAFTGAGRDGKPHRHVLCLYDALRTEWRPTAMIGMPSSKTATLGEVLEAKWSPDGIHIAFARDDNTIDVFDTRWLGQRESMLVFKHDRDGIAWFGNDKLVSGGADHCVRVWDVRKEQECRVVATLAGRIGYLDGSEDPELFPIVAGDQLGNGYYLPNRLLVDRS
ncbi:hypothetical protein RhiLY_03912 [Ceratobasidium sp. AG-Ba]|nr:hypothetical protein RhiLY_03912 [Ceratobasidium sp. AG-Ba]